MFELRVLGSLDLHGPDGEKVVSVLAQPKRAALLAYLALASPRGLHRRDKLIGLFWAERDQESARGALRKAVYFLRQSLGEDVIASQGDDELGLVEGAVTCDALAFEAALEAGELEEALDLYRGDLLEGFYVSDAPEYERWLEAERDRLRGRASEAAWVLAEQQEAAGNGANAASWAKKGVTFSPDDESALRRLLELLDRVGDRAGAAKEYEGFARRLKEEYEIEPSPETQALIAAIREREVAAAGASKLAERPTTGIRPGPTAEPVQPQETATGLRRLVLEVHRRSIWQVLLIYVGGALVAYQAVQSLTEGLGLPDWVPGLAVVAFIVFLPIVVATAFVQEGGPQLVRQEPQPLPEPAAPQDTTGARRVLTWRNSIIGGAAAVVLIAMAAGGYMGMRVMGIGPWGTLMAKGVLEERDLIVLADFEDHTNDSLALVLTDLVGVELEQSPAVRVAADVYVGRVLERMGKEPDVPLTSDLAREVAIREGLKAIIGGEIHRVGSSYVLSLALLAAETGETLASFQETASDLDATIPAIEQMSRKLRERVGESLRTIRGGSPLVLAWTPSLEAARLASEAVRANQRGEYGRAIDFFSRAIEIDTLFAAAYAWRATVLTNLGIESAQRIADATRAYELRHRLPAPARDHVEAKYHLYVTGDREKQIEAWLRVLQFGDDKVAFNDLGLRYYFLRDYARAEEMFRRAIEIDSLMGPTWGNLARALFDQGKFDEAEETLRQFKLVLPDDIRIPLRRAEFASARGDYDSAEVHLRKRRDLRPGSLLYQARYDLAMARLAQVRGNLADAEGYFRRAIAAFAENEQLRDAIASSIGLAGLQVWFRGDTIRALETVADAVVRYPLDSIAGREGLYLRRAEFYAFAGEPERARELLAERESVVSPDLRRTPRRALGAVALAEGRAEEALSDFQFVYERQYCPTCPLPLLGRAYELAGQPDSAVAMYERYLTTPYYQRVLGGITPAGGRDPYWLPEVYERLGDLYEQRGDTAKAIHYYGKLVDLWQDADPVLRPRVEAARRAIEALSPDP